MFGRQNKIAALLLSASLVLGLGACGDEVLDEPGGGHQDASRIEVATRGAVPLTLAIWDENKGWQDNDGNALDTLPNPVDVEGEGLVPLSAGGPRASLSVRFFDQRGEVIPMETLSRDEGTQERECSEYNVRYYPMDNATNIIAWPNVPHPESTRATPSHQFVELADATITGIYHCDHVHIYPASEGSVSLQFMLWHIDHADVVTDPLTLRVEAGS